MELTFYTWIIPFIGLIAPCAIILFGAIFFGGKRIKEPDELSKLGIFLSPFRDAPTWIWILAIISYIPFIVHSVEIWNPETPYISCIKQLFDAVFVVLILSFLIVCCIVTYKREKKKREAKEKNWKIPAKHCSSCIQGEFLNLKDGIKLILLFWPDS